MTPSGVTRRRDLPLDDRAIDRSDLGRGQPLELADLAIDPRHSLPRYSRRRLGWRSIRDRNGADQGQERIIQSRGIAQHVAIRLAMDVHQYGFERRQLFGHCLALVATSCLSSSDPPVSTESRCFSRRIRLTVALSLPSEAVNSCTSSNCWL